MILRLGRGGESAERAAVKAAGKSDDFVFALAVQAGQFDGGFVGLGAAVAEEGLPAEAPLREQPGPFPLHVHVPGVRHMNQRGDLLLHRPHHMRRAMSQQVAPPAGKEIQVAVPLAVPNERALAADEIDRIAVVIADDVAFEKLDGFGGAQAGNLGHGVLLSGVGFQPAQK